MKTLLAFSFCLFGFVGSLAAQSVSTNKTAYLVLEPIVVTYSGLSGDPNDYITVVPANSADSVYKEYHKTGGAVSGTMNFLPQEPGTYEARVHLRNNDNVVSARAVFTVGYPNSTIATDKTAYLVLEPVTVTYSNLPGYPDDYVTIVPANSADSTYWEFYKAATNKNGTMKFTAQLEPGTYEARLHYRNEDPVVRARARFTVSFPASTIATNKSSYAVSEPVTVSYSNLPGYPDDYITLVPASSADSTYWEYYKAAGKKSGTMTFVNKLDPGTYEARLHYRNEDPIVRARARFSVGTTACSFTLAATSAISFGSSGGSGTASVTAGTGCGWSATGNATWITTTSSGTGNGTVNYTVAANTGTSSRTGAVAVSDQTLTITQAGASGGGTPPAAGNLVQNWDAEAGPADPDYNGLSTIPGWTTDGKVTVYRYDSPGNFLSPSSPGQANRGNQYFGGGYSESSRMTQLIDLSASASAIDSGGQPYTLSAWLGGYATQGDNAVLRVTFRNSPGGSALGAGSVGPVSAADRNGVSMLLERTTTGIVPAGARTAELSLEFTRLEGQANDGYADNLYFGLVSGTPTPGTGGKCGGTCSVSSPGQTIGASGGTGSIAVTATSSWDAVAVDTWIQITSGSSGSGNGSVGFTVSANTGAPRSGTIQVAGQTYAVHQSGTASGTTAGCNYLIQSSATQSVPVGGTTSGLIQVVTAQTCAWTATKSATWITIRSGASVTGNGAVAYTVSANDTGSPRSSPIVIAGQVVAINQAGGALPVPPGTPSVSAGGVVNTASYAPGSPPYGSLAQGSFFSIYGSDLGPDEFAKASSYPLPKTLGGVGVQIKQGSNTYDAYLVFASKGQLNAILPSNVPIGTAQVTVTYNGKTSAPANIRVVKTSLGVFFQGENGKDLAIAQNVASATDYPRNLPDTPAKPGQIVILWGTGLGPISGADNGAPGASAGDMTGVPVTITVGGVAAQRLYAGRQPETAAVDNIYFTVPAGVPYGCQVPVAITAGGVAANTTLIAITANGAGCQ